MKKIFLILNIIFLTITAGLLFYYRETGGTVLKGITSSGFVAVGLINLIYAAMSKCKNMKFPVLMFAGLFISMVGDVVLQFNFMIGAIIFAMGHVCYFAAFCTYMKFKNKDTVPCAIIFIGAAMLITLAPCFDFGGNLMLYVCLFYALIISFMTGKTIADFLREKSLLNLILVIGSAMFFFSDLMLVFSIFGGAPKIADTLCLFSYWPAQCVLAYTVFMFVNREKR